MKVLAKVTIPVFLTGLEFAIEADDAPIRGVLRLEDNEDCHKFSVHVPPRFVRTVGRLLKTVDRTRIRLRLRVELVEDE